MKKNYQFFAWLLSIIILTIIMNSYAQAQGPYRKQCITPLNCNFLPGGGVANICSGESITRYAVAVDGDYVLSHTFVWCEEKFVPNPIPHFAYVPLEPAQTLNSVELNTSGTYVCLVTNLDGSYYTGEITLQVASGNPSVTVQPESKNICQGTSSVTFEIEASGDYITDYQWQQLPSGGSWANISGATSDSYIFSPAAGNDGSYYKCLVTNDCGTTPSSAALLDIEFNPTVTSPANKQVCEGLTTNFSVTTNGDVDHTNWWFKAPAGSWTEITSSHTTYSNYTGISLGVNTPNRNLNGYQYKCKVSNDLCGISHESVTPASLTIWTPPEQVQVSLQEATRCVGSSYIVSVNANGTQPFTYQWRKGTTPVGGSATFAINEVSLSDYASYYCYVSNQCGSDVQSNESSLQVITPPNILTHPTDVTEYCEGGTGNTSFSLSAEGAGLNYKWQVKLPGSSVFLDISNDSIHTIDADELNIDHPHRSMDQSVYRCVVVGLCSPPATTNSALLTVKTVPSVLSQPKDTTVCTGEGVSFSINASGTEPMEYYWMKDGRGVGDWISFADFSIIETFLEDDGDEIQCLVRNECAYITAVSSEEAILKVLPPPFVTLGPDIHICTGEETTLDPGSDYISYSWTGGASTRALEVSEQGNYQLTVTDGNGCANSDKVYVFVDPAIPALDLGDDLAFCSGEEITLDATDQYDSYDWSTGAHDQSVDITQTGNYYVTASDNNSVCIESDTIHVQIVEPYQDEEICLITIDRLTGNNIIVWEKTPGMGILAYKIYRQTTVAGKYELLETKPYDDLSIYMDDEADPEVRQWVYKITAVDTCNNESDIKVSPFHRPLFLEYNGVDEGVNLRWEPYVVEGTEIEFKTYEIHRGSDSIALSKLDEISGDLRVYKDKDPNALTFKYFYRVAGVKFNPCYPTGGKKADSEPYKHSMSNIEDNRRPVVKGVNNLKSAGAITIYPNPFTDFATLKFTNPDHSNYRLVIRDLSGKMVSIQSNITGEMVVLERGNLTPGYYLLELAGEKIYRGRVIVE